ncbi:hypothetical protein K443DRAFT_457319 [Laccaria amethystina LaAM-08-1]|uniref:Uncharacterized protein n=1 Tax=Laccaria amethystina LaAM-08-1 TaxID=1095629 RepID=A0A0C9XQH4_9AGAR|nr:hypothetical protein K443DRAFT_457319 [Laccaria amethystina LaAM-08-1]
MAPQPLPPRLHAPTKFYRAVTRRQEMPDVHSIYQPGRSPTHYTEGRPGDFCYDGALYAFTDQCQAMEWGKAITSHKLSLSRDGCFYLVELDYTPRGLPTTTFHSDTPQWCQVMIVPFTHCTKFC